MEINIQLIHKLFKKYILKSAGLLHKVLDKIRLPFTRPGIEVEELWKTQVLLEGSSACSCNR